MSDEGITVIDCGDTFDMANVADMYMRMLSHLAEDDLIQFNVSKVERIDTAAMQMIYAFSKEATQQGHILRWEGASDVFVRTAELLGVATLMNTEGRTI
tara:strand:- start:25795 stop:26091 length:297 start_codon:yes stop_codon:yes gene_type:complete